MKKKTLCIISVIFVALSLCFFASCNGCNGCGKKKRTEKQYRSYAYRRKLREKGKTHNRKSGNDGRNDKKHY